MGYTVKSKQNLEGIQTLTGNPIALDAVFLPPSLFFMGCRLLFFFRCLAPKCYLQCL